MKIKDLISELDNVDPALLDVELKNANARRRRRTVYRVLASAAALAILVVSILALSGVFSSRGITKPVPITPSDDALPSGSASLIYGGNVVDLPSEFEGLKVTPVEASGRTVGNRPSFTLTTQSPTSVETISKYTYLVPETRLAFSGISDTEFRVDTLESLPSGSNIRFCVGDKERPEISFAFETESVFGVDHTLPANYAMNVPVNTGIEITFTEKLAGVDDLTKYITVAPQTEYTAELYPDGKTLLILPSEKLKENCNYSVYIKKGLSSVFGKEDKSGYAFAFTTSGAAENTNNEINLNFSAADYFPLPGKASGFTFYVSGRSRDAEYEIEADVYSVNGMDELTEKVFALLETGKDYDVSGLRKVATAEAEQSSGRSYEYFCRIPGLDKGIYILSLKAADASDGELTAERRLLLQVSDVSAYVEFCDGTFTVFATDKGDVPLEGVNVSYVPLSQKFLPETKDFAEAGSQTDKNGVMTFGLDASGLSGTLIKLTKGADSLLIPFLNEDLFGYLGRSTDLFGGGSSPREAFFVYTDREEYFASDTLNFSGFTTYRPEEGERLWYSFTETEKMPLELKEDGTFSGSYTFDSYAYGNMALYIFSSDGSRLYGKSITVTEREKPKYTASLTFDKPFYVKGDTVNVTLTAAYFDGTPAEGLSFTIGFGGGSIEYLTDSDGKATASIEAFADNSESDHPGRIYASAKLVGSEMTDLSVSASAVYFHFDTWLRKSETKTDGDKLFAEIYTNELDLTKIKTFEDTKSGDFPQNTVGKAVTKTLSVALRKVTYTKRKTGTKYDAISKTSEPVYTWDKSEQEVSRKSMTAEDGVLRLDFIDNAGENEFFYYDVYLDGVKISFYANGGKNRYITERVPYDRLTTDKSSYKVGETVRIVFTPGEEYEIGCRMLTIWYNGGYDRFFPDGNEYTFTYKKEYVFGARAVLAYFKNGKPKSIPILLSFNAENNKLKVETVSDRSEYRPGDKASVKVRVTDANGTPVPGAKITLSVVDEACFALREQKFDALTAYYSSGVRNPDVKRNAYIGKVLFNAAEIEVLGGTGGIPEYENGASVQTLESAKAHSDGYRIRKDFENTPLFTDVVLDGKGEAELVFTVPDNVTSWRITTVAHSGLDAKTAEAYIGQSVTSVISTLPVFLDVETAKNYLESDSVCVSFKFAGNLLKKGDRYTVVASVRSGDKVVSEKTLTGWIDGSKRQFIDFGTLEKGFYTVWVSAECGEFRDGVEYGFNVIESGVGAFVTVPMTLDELKNITPARYPLNLTFCDPAQREYLSALYGALGRNTSRADAKAAAIKAAELLKALTQSENELDDLANRLVRELNDNHNDHQGRFSLLPYGSGDIKLTALICAFSPSALYGYRKDSIAVSLESQLRKDEFKNAESICYAYLALASLDRPVLNDILYLAKTKTDWSAEARLTLANALALLGDHPSASEIYGEIRAKMYKENSDGSAYLTDGKMSVDESVSLTSLALTAASEVAPEDAGRYDLYIVQHRSSVETFDLQRLFYLAHKRLGAEGSKLVVTRNGKTEEITLKGWERYSVDLNTLSGFEAVSDDGVIVLASYYATGETLENSLGKCDEITLNKRIERMGNGFYKVIIDYTVTTDKTGASFRISDSLPSGTKYCNDYTGSGGHSTKNTGGGTFCLGGQNVGGYITVWNNTSDGILKRLEKRTYTGSVSYVVRAAIDGSYTVEKAVALSYDGRAAFSNDCGKYEFSSKVNNGFVN